MRTNIVLVFVAVGVILFLSNDHPADLVVEQLQRITRWFK